MRTLVLFAALSACACGPASQAGGIPEYTYQIVHTYPHDRDGVHPGTALPATACSTRAPAWTSSRRIRKVKLETGEVLQKRDVPGQYFGEGIVVWKDRLLELTWKAEKGFIYDLATFTPKGEFPYPGEGWGLTTDGKRIIMSDGTAELRFWDPETLKETGRITVTDDGRPVTELNELEWVKGEIYANVWQTDRIARIDPATGKVVGWIDCQRPADSRRSQRPDRCPQWHRLRCQGRPPVRDRQAVAQAVRDQAGETDTVGQASRPVPCQTVL